MINFDVGDKVVCINDKFEHGWVHSLYKALPVAGQTYVVRDVRLGIQQSESGRKWTGGVSILLIGLVNPHSPSRAGHEYGFAAERFRKLDEIKDETAELQSQRTIVPTEVSP